MSDKPAFPQNPRAIANDQAKGMTLRDYFAAKALQGMLAKAFSPTHPTYDANETANMAYELADAMLEARES